MHVEVVHEYLLLEFSPYQEILSLHIAETTCPRQPFSRTEI
jgi:hypothetical protein